MAAPSLGRCASMGTVAATVASASFAEAVLELASTAVTAGFPCLVVQPYEQFDALNEQHVLPLPLPAHPLLPRPMWCTWNWTGATSPSGGHVAVGWYGWRRSHLHRVRMFVAVLSSGHSLLAVDLDWRFAGPSPLPAIYALKAPNGGPLDVFSWWDGSNEKMYNVGLLWVRASPEALSMVQRVLNRTFSGWEQALFNEELQWRSALSCCHSRELMWNMFNQSRRDHRAKANVNYTRWRIHVEGQPRCAEEGTLPPAEPPPNGSAYVWNTREEGGWHALDYNVLRVRHWGRCAGGRDNTCLGRAEAKAAYARVGGTFKV